MLIFSTRLPVKDTLTKGKFFELVIRWNQDSPHHWTTEFILHTEQREIGALPQL